jgi:hypothetical protein
MIPVRPLGAARAAGTWILRRIASPDHESIAPMSQLPRDFLEAEA